MSNFHIALIAGIVVIIFIVYKIIKTVSKIRRIRSSGSNAHKKDIFYRIISKVFMKDLPD